jgi:tripeptide aminopeptidase
MRAYERLLEYVKWPTVSDSGRAGCPSTEGQRAFGEYLVKEMLALGVADAAIDDNGYVMGTVPSNVGTDVPIIGFIAHMDVSDAAPSVDIKARVVEKYDGGDILLNKKEGIVMSPEAYESLAGYNGDDLIVTDGTTLLGGDDKSGVAEILTMAEHLLTHPEIKHGTIKIGFTPDEEIGRGADLFDVERFGADFAYTVDGGAFGEVIYENFNAAAADVTVTGVSIHPGTAKDTMLNASLLAMEFQSLLPPAQRPEHTDGYEGFFHLTGMEGHVEQAKLSYILRDHDSGKLEQKKKILEQATDYLNAKYGAGTIALKITDSYQNMAEIIKDHWQLVETACQAIEALGEKPIIEPIRGGTDGASLSYMGLPCPNLGTGGHNCHGRMEYVCVQAMDRCVALLVKISEIYAGKTPL